MAATTVASQGGMSRESLRLSREMGSASDVVEARKAASSAYRKRATAFLLVFGLAFLALSSLALVAAISGPASVTTRENAVGGSAGLAIGAFLLLGAIGIWSGRGPLTRQETSYGESGWGRWAVKPTAQDEAPIWCAKCGARNLGVSPACWKCGSMLQTR